MSVGIMSVFGVSCGKQKVLVTMLLGTGLRPVPTRRFL